MTRNMLKPIPWASMKFKKHILGEDDGPPKNPAMG